MINLEEACKIAIEKFIKKGYLNGLVDIVDIGDRWLLFGTMLGESGVTEYGNCPYAVNKENGECQEFPISIIENFDLYYEGEIIEVPEKYRFTAKSVQPLNVKKRKFSDLIVKNPNGFPELPKRK